MAKRKSFLESVHYEHVQKFLNFIELNKDGSDPFDLAEVLVELQSSQREDLWENLLKLLQHSLNVSPPESWITGAEEDAGDMEVEVSEEQTLTMAIIEGVTIVSTVSVDSLQENDNYTSLVQCAHVLNCVESCLPLSHIPLQQAIHWLFECWWNRDLQGKEDFGLTAFLVCLENAITISKPVNQLKRLYSLREVLLSVDFTSEKGQQVIDPLLQFFLNVQHFQLEEILEDVLSVQDTATMARLLEIIVILWKTVQKSIEGNQEAYMYVTTKFASSLPQYLKVFQEEQCKTPLIILASLLPASALPSL
ncbi:hypothetical protein DNTS_014206, partial [Danionella cerebrum]